ncbi:hypothetical protein Anapl_17316 [Anas platyrhynchos]|uniref:Uncharacterized protein n=1 Tax=Anas platyrhynchos TaxID=8839 RepID=R0KPN9_ANAPL|nr:hypothetical protein Anapl_17316 [Anas platyrhynchos]
MEGKRSLEGEGKKGEQADEWALKTPDKGIQQPPSSSAASCTGGELPHTLTEAFCRAMRRALLIRAADAEDGKDWQLMLGLKHALFFPLPWREWEVVPGCSDDAQCFGNYSHSFLAQARPEICTTDFGQKASTGYCSPESSFLSCTRSLSIRGGWPLRGVQEASLADRGFQIKTYPAVFWAAAWQQGKHSDSTVHREGGFSMLAEHLAAQILTFVSSYCPRWTWPSDTALSYHYRRKFQLYSTKTEGVKTILLLKPKPGRLLPFRHAGASKTSAHSCRHDRGPNRYRAFVKLLLKGILKYLIYLLLPKLATETVLVMGEADKERICGPGTDDRPTVMCNMLASLALKTLAANQAPDFDIARSEGSSTRLDPPSGVIFPPLSLLRAIVKTMDDQMCPGKQLGPSAEKGLEKKKARPQETLSTRFSEHHFLRGRHPCLSSMSQLPDSPAQQSPPLLGRAPPCLSSPTPVPPSPAWHVVLSTARALYIAKRWAKGQTNEKGGARRRKPSFHASSLPPAPSMHPNLQQQLARSQFVQPLSEQ